MESAAFAPAHAVEREIIVALGSAGWRPRPQNCGAAAPELVEAAAMRARCKQARRRLDLVRWMPPTATSKSASRSKGGLDSNEMPVRRCSSRCRRFGARSCPADGLAMITDVAVPRVTLISAPVAAVDDDLRRR